MKGIQLVRSVLFSMVVLGGFMSMSGCNTVEGVGKDTAKAGEKIQDVAKPSK